jgi:heme exporter protein C
MIRRFASPKVFYPLAGKLMPWFGWAFALFAIVGLYWGLVIAPTDAVQGEAYRIMFVHVPAAWMSMMIYGTMTSCAVVTLIWRTKVAEYWLLSSPVLGASFTFLALVTGSLWGKPMWGAWWVWDARLTSELILLFIYFAILAMKGAIPDQRKAARVMAMLTIVGSVNIPIIKFSVNWWTTLHQPASIFRAAGVSIAPMMLTALLLMALSFTFYYFWLVLKNIRVLIERKEK